MLSVLEVVFLVDVFETGPYLVEDLVEVLFGLGFRLWLLGLHKSDFMDKR